MKLLPSSIPGCHEIVTEDFMDQRGVFFKTFHIGVFQDLGLETNWKEEYFSLSHKNVIRGMHFQTPPMDHAKIVTCLSGSVVDVVLDLRKNSPTYLEYADFRLTAGTENKMVYIPTGCAHGFLALQNHTLLQYKVSSIYSPENDSGISWDSFGFDWGVNSPIISERDIQQPSLQTFITPFGK